ncbi:MAG: tetratricopeptide repeat protein [Cyclobacteriaceae bacterium]|jgi:tetratricopeptide (TPR) repeat protein
MMSRYWILAFILCAYSLKTGFSQIQGNIILERYEKSKLNVDFDSENARILSVQKYNDAIDSLNENPDSKELLYYRAMCHYINSQAYKAFEDISIYLKQPGANGYYANLLLAKIEYLRLKKFQAIEALDRAMAMEPGKPLAYIEKSRIYALTGNTDEGLSFINRQLKRFPDQASFYLFRGLLMQYSQNEKKAIQDISIYLSSGQLSNKSDLILAHFNLAQCYTSIKDYGKALVQVNKGLEMFPDYSPGYGVRGEIYFYLKDYRAALNDFLVMEERYKSSAYFGMQGFIYENLGELAMACQYYTEACNLAPMSKECAKVRKLRCK